MTPAFPAPAWMVGCGNMAGAMTALQNLEALKVIFVEGGEYDVAADALTAACPAEIQQLDAAANS